MTDVGPFGHPGEAKTGHITVKEKNSGAQSGECFKDDVCTECESAVAVPGTV